MAFPEESPERASGSTTDLDYLRVVRNSISLIFGRSALTSMTAAFLISPAAARCVDAPAQ